MLTAVKPISLSTPSRSTVPCSGSTSMARSPVTGMRGSTSAKCCGYRVGVPPPTYKEVKGPAPYMSISVSNAAK